MRENEQHNKKKHKGREREPFSNFCFNVTRTLRKFCSEKAEMKIYISAHKKWKFRFYFFIFISCGEHEFQQQGKIGKISEKFIDFSIVERIEFFHIFTFLGGNVSLPFFLQTVSVMESLFFVYWKANTLFLLRIFIHIYIFWLMSDEERDI